MVTPRRVGGSGTGRSGSSNPIPEPLSSPVTLIVGASMGHFLPGVPQTRSNPVKPSQAQSNPAKPSQTQSNPIKPNQTQSNPIKPGQTRSNPVKPAQTQSNPLKPSQTRSNPVKPVQTRSNPVKPGQTQSNQSAIPNRRRKILLPPHTLWPPWHNLQPIVVCPCRGHHCRQSIRPVLRPVRRRPCEGGSFSEGGSPPSFAKPTERRQSAIA